MYLLEAAAFVRLLSELHSTPQDRDGDFFSWVSSVFELKIEEPMPRSDEGFIHLHCRQHTAYLCRCPEGVLGPTWGAQTLSGAGEEWVLQHRACRNRLAPLCKETGECCGQEFASGVVTGRASAGSPPTVLGLLQKVNTDTFCQRLMKGLSPSLKQS